MDDQGVYGRALDAWIAVNLFGFRWVLDTQRYKTFLAPVLTDPDFPTWGNVLEGPGVYKRFADWDRWVHKYSADLVAAWPIAEAIRAWLPQPSLMIEGTNFAGPAWTAAAADQEVSAETLPMALCMLAKELGEAHPDFLVSAQRARREPCP